MKGQVKKWGNSLAVRIPAPVAEALGLKENAPVQLAIMNGRLTIAARIPHTQQVHNCRTG